MLSLCFLPHYRTLYITLSPFITWSGAQVTQLKLGNPILDLVSCLDSSLRSWTLGSWDIHCYCLSFASRDNGTRAELMDHVEKNQESVIRSVCDNMSALSPVFPWVCATIKAAHLTDIWEEASTCSFFFICFNLQGEQDETYGAQFVYTAHKDEIILAGVFVRIYNEQVSQVNLSLFWAGTFSLEPSASVVCVSMRTIKSSLRALFLPDL